ncbi:hypothetical protein VTJ83DRAFT_5752 [Remersonia thermophila]|uniref:Factor arrest protein 11 n=1 Tax=Remersonia thermophila TaxID=72144 RepID=A0ABR4D8I1_9PEZI
MNVLWPSRAAADGNGQSDDSTAVTPESTADTAPSDAINTTTTLATPSSTTTATPATNPADAATVDPHGPTPQRPALHRDPTAPPPAVPSVPAPPIPESVPDPRGRQLPGQPPQAPTPLQVLVQQQQQQQQQHQPYQPPPPPPPAPQNSLSVAELRRMLAELPRAEALAYDYVYADTAPTDEEIDEWFVYNFWQWVRLNAANRAFYSAWARLAPPPSEPADGSDPQAGAGAGAGAPAAGWDWDGRLAGEEEGEGDEERRRQRTARRRAAFVSRVLDQARSGDRIARAEAVGALVYLALGRWSETVKAAGPGALAAAVVEGKTWSAATEAQLRAMRDGVRILAERGGLEVVWDALRAGFALFWSDEVLQNVQMAAEELINLMTILYVVIQETLDDPEGMADVRRRLLALNPGLLRFLLQAVVRLRWDETGLLPQTQIFLLFWKAILLVFGGSKALAAAKEATSELKGCDDKQTITASPLDYHVFRQEITSKYPAYIPPQPLLPLEPDQNTIIPPLPNHPTRSSASNGVRCGPGHGGASILHQPVHIATPAPSPPPSPGVGGKGAKKHNYQTNQNFPFMYPPLDATSNSAGGKGGAGLQDLLVGRKWEGSDVPASILEAGELFSKRVRMSRATRQLWEEREEFLKFERGYEADGNDDIVDELDLSSLTLEEKELLGLDRIIDDEKPRQPPRPGTDYGPRELSADIKERLDAVEEFYKEALPHLQSLVIVLLRQVTAMTSNPPSANGPQGPAGARANGGQQTASAGPNGAAKGDPSSPLDADLDELRNREIAAKAVTGALILLLKWLKLSHVLKFEYMTQLLLDSNYLPMALKIFAMYDVQQMVESKTDRLEHSFFYFCGSRAGVIPTQNSVPNPTATEFEDIDEDDAAPPPIKRRRSPPTAGAPSDTDAPGSAAEDPVSSSSTTTSATAATAAPEAQAAARPEVDELGHPVNPLPAEPITDFSRRNFFSLINYLRVMQKICKHRAHRNLLLVQFKSSNILRKTLKVPQHELRLYTLKLFKNQVPYTGRKWRQSNMRVITAVYLHCRPELRDEWLAGSNVEDQVDDAVPLEQALRSLTHWYNLRRYPDRMAAGGEWGGGVHSGGAARNGNGNGGGNGAAAAAAAAAAASLVKQALKEEQDFFVRELEKADWSWMMGEGSVAGSEDGGVGDGMMGGWEEATWG